MQFTHQVLVNGVVLVDLAGRIDGTNASDLAAELLEITSTKYYRIVIVMPDVTYTSSAALAVLLDAWKRCRRYNRGNLVLVSVNPNIKKVFELTGHSNLFECFDREGPAVAFVSSRVRKSKARNKAEIAVDPDLDSY